MEDKWKKFEEEQLNKNGDIPAQPQNEQPQYTPPQYTQPQYEQPQYAPPQQEQQPPYYPPQTPYYPQGQPPVYGQPEKDNSKGFAVASLVLGICSFFCCGFIFSILGFVFGMISRSRKAEGNSMATVGIILSVLGFVATIVSLIVMFTSGTYEALVNEIMYY